MPGVARGQRSLPFAADPRIPPVGSGVFPDSASPPPALAAPARSRAQNDTGVNSMRTNPHLQAKSGSSACRIGVAALALAGIAGIATPASAQDEFSGFRVEALAGYDNEGVDYDDDVLDGGKRSDDGFAFGAGAGYDIQMDRFVFGVEGDFVESTNDREYDERGSRPPRPAQPI